MRNELMLTNTNNLWNPIRGLSSLQREIDRLFDDFMTTGYSPESRREYFTPACDVEETDSAYLMSFDLPGVSKDEIKIETHQNQLTISGRRHLKRASEKDGVRLTERYAGKFERTFTLPTSIESDKIEAQYQDGVLRVILPKAESAKARQIKITDGKGGVFGKLLSHKDEAKKVDKVA